MEYPADYPQECVRWAERISSTVHCGRMQKVRENLACDTAGDGTALWAGA